MKNIVKVCRFKDNATRLYQLPTCVVLERGTTVEVELANGATALGVTVSASYCGEYEEHLIRDMFNVLPGVEFKRVVAVCERQEVVWNADEAIDETADDADDEATDDASSEAVDSTIGEIADEQ